MMIGEVQVRTPQGTSPARAGDLVCFPAGADGAHQVWNEPRAPRARGDVLRRRRCHRSLSTPIATRSVSGPATSATTGCSAAPRRTSSTSTASCRHALALSRSIVVRGSWPAGHEPRHRLLQTAPPSPRAGVPWGTHGRPSHLPRIPGGGRVRRDRLRLLASEPAGQPRRPRSRPVSSSRTPDGDDDEAGAGLPAVARRGRPATRGSRPTSQQQLSGRTARRSTASASGPRTSPPTRPSATAALENVIATRPGVGSGTIVVVSHRDATAARRSPICPGRR